MDAEGRFRDDGQRSKRTYEKLRQIEAGNVLDDFPAAADDLAVSTNRLDAYDEILERAVRVGAGAIGIHRKHPADSHGFATWGIEGETLLVLPKHLLQLVERDPGFSYHDLILRRVIHDAVQT